MENATKALEMAGSVLIGVLLLGCLLFAYTRMSELKDTEHKVEVSEQAKDFNQDYEAYNRNNLYGSDLFSLANKIEDYNKQEADGKAYGKIEMKVTVKTTPGRDAKFFKAYTYTGDTLNEKYIELSNAINEINKKKNYFNGKSVSYWANYGTSTRLENQIATEMNKTVQEVQALNSVKTLKENITTYQNYLTEQKDMARKSFKCTSIEYYDDTGRVKYMEFTEK